MQHPTTTLPNAKPALRAYVARATAAYLANGGKVQACPPARARGAGRSHMWVQPATLPRHGTRCSTPTA